MIKKVKLHRKQAETFKLLTENNEIRYILFGGGAEGGKTWISWFWLTSMCMKYPDTRWFCGREELKRLRTTTLKTFFKMCKMYGIENYKYNAQDYYIEFENGSTIELLELS